MPRERTGKGAGRETPPHVRTRRTNRWRNTQRLVAHPSEAKKRDPFAEWEGKDYLSHPLLQRGLRETEKNKGGGGGAEGAEAYQRSEISHTPGKEKWKEASNLKALKRKNENEEFGKEN